MKAIIFLTLLFFCAKLLADESFDVINHTSVSKDSNFVFIGIENSIQLIAPPGEIYSLKSVRSIVKKGPGRNTFTVYSNSTGIDTFYILKNKKVVFKKQFHAVRLREPVLNWGALRQDYASVQEVIVNRGIAIRIPNCQCKPLYRIVSFKMDIESANISNADKQMQFDGNRLDGKAISVVKKLKPGDVINFNSIRVVGSNSVVREFPPFSITIR